MMRPRGRSVAYTSRVGRPQLPAPMAELRRRGVNVRSENSIASVMGGVAEEIDLTRLHEILALLLDRTGASRTTLRWANRESGPVLIAEVCAPGVSSMRDSSLRGVAEAPTYLYLLEHRRFLIQEDCLTDPVAPPRSLVDDFDVSAQMLAPVTLGDAMIATISVHHQGAPRAWSESDVESLMAAQLDVTATIGASERL